MPTSRNSDFRRGALGLAGALTVLLCCAGTGRPIGRTPAESIVPANATRHDPGPVVAQRDQPPDAAGLLEGVEAIPPVGTVGQVALWGDGAFAVVLGKQGNAKVPIVGAASLGRGRVMAWAHSYGTAAAAARLSTGRLLVNSCRWASGHAGPVRIALIDSDLAPFLTEQGLEAAKIAGGDTLAAQLQGATVLLCGRSNLSDREVAVISRFVSEGGGFVCFSCPWGWAQIHHRPVAEIPLNRILTPAGVALAEGYAEPTRDGAFEAAAAPGVEFHAGHALDILVSQGEHKDPLVAQAGSTAMRAVRALPQDDLVLRPRLEALLGSRTQELIPSPQRPLRESHALDRVLLALQLSRIESQKPADVRAHPASLEFPGAVPAAAQELSREIVIDTRVPKWHSTGLYAAPGRVITITLPRAVQAPDGLRVRIGAHTDDLSQLDQWRRIPRISSSWAIDGAEVQVASAFGGLIYIEVPERARAERVAVGVAGAVEAPLFILGRTTNEEWTSRLRDLPGPWAELACDRVILTIPSAVAQKVDDPQAIMEHWTRVLDADADLAGIPRERPCPQRYVADVQISAGYMHSGYPIMTHLDAAAFMTNSKGLVDSGWGLYHEMGHNHQEGMWTFGGTGEVTCNIFTLYVLETVCGVKDASEQKVAGDKAARARAKYLAEGAQFEKWKGDPFLALQMYAQLRLAFGWEVYRKVFAEYRALKPDERPRTDEQKRDEWMVRMSRATGRNLGPFFEAWGVPITPPARDSVKDLPAWMPEDMRGN